MKKAILAIAGVALCLAACGGKEAPAEEELDPSKEVSADKGGDVDPNLEKDVESLPGLDEIAGDEEDPELERATSVGDAGKGERTLTLELTAAQREDLERQREKNRASGRRDVTVKFTPEQMEAVREVCPECREKAITWNTDRVGVRVKLRFDAAGHIVKPPEPFPYVSR
jgi:hypothetical protein